MRVVSNTSPLLFLSKINRLSLLSACFSEIYAPPAVFKETKGIKLPSSIMKCAISAEGVGFVQGTLGRLHHGELEAMRLAQELKANIVLLDDMAARRKATRMGLQVMGTVGVLLLANRQGDISAQQTIDAFNNLIDKHNLYLSEQIRRRIEQEIQ